MARATQAALPEVRALANLGDTLRLSGDLAGAETYLWEAVEAWEKLQQAIGPRDVQKVLFLDQQITYWVLLMVLVAQNKFVEALVLTEHRRTSAFNELVIRQLAANPNSKSSTTLPVVAPLNCKRSLMSNI
jgi:hypothetical protein